MWSFYSDFSCFLPFPFLLPPLCNFLLRDFYSSLLYYNFRYLFLSLFFSRQLTYFSHHSSLYLMYYFLIFSMPTITPCHGSEMSKMLMRIYLKELLWCLLCPQSDSKKNSKALLCRTLLKKYSRLFLVENATVFYLVTEASTGCPRGGDLGHSVTESSFCI